jgi:hypothetical protein
MALKTIAVIMLVIMGLKTIAVIIGQNIIAAINRVMMVTQI